MSDKPIKITYEKITTESGRRHIALAQGWTEEIQNPDHDPTDKDSKEFIKNPKSYDDHIKDYLDNHFVELAAYQANKELELQKQEALSSIREAAEQAPSTIKSEDV